MEDPLSEELLRGAFQGQNLITIRVKEVGDQKQLDFEGSVGAENELAAVGSSADEGGKESEKD